MTTPIAALGMWGPLLLALLQDGLITDAQADQAAALTRTTGERLDRALLRVGAPEVAVAQALARTLGYDYCDPVATPPDPAVVRLLPRELAMRHQLVPVRMHNGEIEIACLDPLNHQSLRDVKLLTGRPIRPLVTTESALQQALSLAYPTDQILGQLLAQESAADGSTTEVATDALLDPSTTGGAPAVQAVNLLVLKAMQDGASDLHLQPGADAARVRYRIDGLLSDAAHLPRPLHESIIARIKAIAGMDVSERRLPQDGRLRVRVDNQILDLRLATLPTTYGEELTLRILRLPATQLTFAKLGMDAFTADIAHTLVHKPGGLLLVCGTTGSGKTTTVYTLLQRLNMPERNIITVEDPVEYDIAGASQVNVNPRIGLGFATSLRSILRNDPDIIMVGEIRDTETAKVAIEAALTGHMVLSTLHTRTATGAVTRLLEMGVEPYLITSALRGVVAQRLVRVLCPECRIPYRPEPEALVATGCPTPGPDATWYRPGGCARCRTTGYRGRTGVFEALAISPGLRQLVLRREPDSVLREHARRDGLRTMQEDACTKLTAGLTGLEEVLRITADGEEDVT